MEDLFMGKDHINRLLSGYEKIFEELYVADTIVNVTKSSCLNREFSGQYYGTTGEYSEQLSSERNNYINMLTILSEKISNIKELNITLEKEILLEKNSHNRCRKVTAESSANKSS